MNWTRLPVVRHPSADLLIVQLLGLLLYPFLGEQPLGRAIFSILALLVLVLALMTVRMTPALSWISGLLGLPVVVLTIWEALSPGAESVVLWSSVFHAAFYFYTAFALIRYMFDDHVVTTDELYATGATFTVVAWAFAYVYLAVEIVWPQSISGVGAATDAKTWFEMLFLSVTTLTNTGLSDMAPASPQARSVVMLQEIAGVLYIGLVVARMLALTVTRAGGGSGSSSGSSRDDG